MRCVAVSCQYLRLLVFHHCHRVVLVPLIPAFNFKMLKDIPMDPSSYVIMTAFVF